MKDIHYLLLAEIIDGYSVLSLDKGVNFYFKHPIVKDVLKESLQKRDLEKQAERIGLKSKEELLSVAYTSGKWSKENDETIQGLEFSIKSKNKILNKIEDIHIKKTVLQQIEDDSKELKKLLNEKSKLILASKEAFVEKKLISVLYSGRLFHDKSFLEPLDEQELDKAFRAYIEKFLELNDRDNLLRVAFCNDFFDYFIIYEDISNIFNKPALELTIFQKNILVYGNILISKLKNCSNMPSDVKTNPIKIYEWSENNSKKSVDTEDFNIREKVKRAGGLENMKPEDKIT